MSQSSFYGPKIKLTYQCGTESVDFTSQQNYSMLAAGEITVVTSDESWGLTAHNEQQRGSAFGQKEKGGEINWMLFQALSHVFTVHNNTTDYALKYDEDNSFLGRNLDATRESVGSTMGMLVVNIYPDPRKQEISPGKSSQFIIRRLDSDGLNSGYADIYFKAINNKTGAVNECYMRIQHYPSENRFTNKLSLDVYTVNEASWFSSRVPGDTFINCQLQGTLGNPVYGSNEFYGVTGSTPADIIVTQIN